MTKGCLVLFGLFLLANSCIGQEPPASLLPQMNNFLSQKGWVNEDGFWIEDKGKWYYTADLKTRKVDPDTAVQTGSAFMGTMSISLAYREVYFNKKGEFKQALTYCPVEYLCEALQAESCPELKKTYKISSAMADDVVELREKSGRLKVYLEGKKTAQLKTGLE